jgi:hypothetical protein
MAKGQRDDRGRVKFRLIEFEFEGGNASIQESLRSLASALRVNREQVIALPAPPERPAVPGGEFPEEPAPKVAQPEVLGGEQSEQSMGSRPRVKTFRSPVVLDLELTSGDVPLQKYCESKNPDSDSKKYLIIAAWLKQHRNIAVITADHIHTCYRHMGWHTPKDAVQPLRDMKSKNGWFGKGAGRGEYAINHIGENEVAKMGS